MTLTEQWKNKELEWHKSYYCKNKKGDVCIATIMGDDTLYSQELGGSLNFEYWEVLVPVPSYQEWQASEKYNKHIEAEIKEKETQRIELMTRLNDVNNENHALEIENAKLKELLKKCRLAIFDYPPYNSASDKIRLKNKIDDVLGEKK